MVAIVLKTMGSLAFPDYIKGTMIASTYFIATGSTQAISKAGNNFAKSFPKIIISSQYIMILWYALSMLGGLVFGIVLYNLITHQNMRGSKIDLNSEEMMEQEELMEEKQTAGQKMMDDAKSDKSI